MTEDDTFRALSKISVQQMVSIYRRWLYSQRGDWTADQRRRLFNDNGWGVQEFIEEHKKRNLKLPHD